MKRNGAPSGLLGNLHLLSAVLSPATLHTARLKEGRPGQRTPVSTSPPHTPVLVLVSLGAGAQKTSQVTNKSLRTDRNMWSVHIAHPRHTGLQEATKSSGHDRRKARASTASKGLGGTKPTVVPPQVVAFGHRGARTGPGWASRVLRPGCPSRGLQARRSSALRAPAAALPVGGTLGVYRGHQQPAAPAC